MTVINTNVGAVTARTFARQSSYSVEESIERLSSGKRLNSGADDAAGLAVANKMEAQLRSTNMSIQNASNGISLIQSAGAGMNKVNSMLIRIREVAVQMANGIYTDEDRTNGQAEVVLLQEEIDKIAENLQFNEVYLLDGSYQQSFRTGVSNDETFGLSIISQRAEELGKAEGLKKFGTTIESSAHSTGRTNTTIDITAANSVTIEQSSFSQAMQQFASENGGGTYVLSGTDAGEFQILDASSGKITSNSAVSYNSTSGASNTKSLTVTYTSGANTFTDQLSVNVANNTSDAVVKASQTNLTTSETANMSFRSVDSDNATDGQLSNSMQSFVTADTGTGTFSLSGTDAAQFTIDATTGVITAALDFENKLDTGSNNTYDFNVVYTSSTGDSFTETVALSVTDSTEEMDSITSADFTTLEGGAGLDAGSTLSVVADGQTITASLNADDAAMSVADAVTLLNAANDARGANAARGTFAAGSVANTIEFTYSDSVGNYSGTRVSTVTVSDFEQAAADTTTAGITIAQAARDAVASSTTYSGLSGNLNVAEAGDSFEIILNGTTTLSASVAAGTNAGDFSVQDLADAFTAANNALGTPETVTFSTNGADLVATHNTAGTSYTFQPTLSFVDGGTTATVGTSSSTAAVTAQAQAMDFSFSAAGPLATTETAFDTSGDNYHIELTIDGVTYKSAEITNAGATATENASDFVTALNANSAFAELYTATNTSSAAVAQQFTIDLTDTTTATGNPAAIANEFIALNDGTNSLRYKLSVGDTDNAVATGLASAIQAHADYATATVSGNIITVTRNTAGPFNMSNYSVANLSSAGNVDAVLTETVAGTSVSDILTITSNTAGTEAAATYTNIGFRYADQTIGTSATTNQGTSSLANTGATNNMTNGRDNSTAGNATDAAATNELSANYAQQQSSSIAGANTVLNVADDFTISFTTSELSDLFTDFVADNPFGKFSLSGTDLQQFRIDSFDGTVNTTAAFKASPKDSYNIDITYTGKNGNTFMNNVTVNRVYPTNVAKDSVADINISTVAGATEAITILDRAINQMAAQEATMGAAQNRLEHAIDYLSMAGLNTEASKGRIVDADFATVSSNLAKQQILNQASSSMLAQANQSKQMLLSLLR